MSKRKHNIAYIKPNEPKFLRLIKEQIGYKEGPTVDTKRERREYSSDSDREDHEGEKPVVVVLKKGDLTAEEAEAFQQKQEEEEANKPADLTQKIIFNKTKSRPVESEKSDVSAKEKTKKQKKKKMVLSFDEDEEGC